MMVLRQAKQPSQMVGKETLNVFKKGDGGGGRIQREGCTALI